MLLYDTLSFPMTEQPRSWIFSCYQSYMSQSFCSERVGEEFHVHHKILEPLLDYFIQRFDIKTSSPVSYSLSTEAPYIVRVLKALIDATVRTNLYVPDAVALTIDIHHDLHEISEIQRIPGMRELYVFHPEVEGVHLRASPISRGGIRLSEREDYRKEAFDLLQTQRLKNAVVVPDGAKAVLRVRHGVRPEQGYRRFVQGLLTVMDNLDDYHKPIAAPGVRALDEPDYYLVAAPDKGTSSYADIANNIALTSGFWLKDAFASGGSTGYDHKKLGITSKGVWVSVECHLRQLGRTVTPDHPISVVGVGDMSGDVFGNGLLYSKNVKLLAAFDHRHIFLDPDPDPEQSYQERCRLFHLSSSSWMDYDLKVLSLGGQIISRNLSQVPLSPLLRTMLQLPHTVTTPEALISALFKIKCDVLWLAGIGTYIVDVDEEESIGDKSNASLRVFGQEVGATIIAEGANLGCTQKGRRAFAKAGGIINTDAIDNCAGVMCSDQEVNFKILFQSISVDEVTRNSMMQEMTEEMIRKVLNQNYWQNISLYALQRSEKYSDLTRPELAVYFLEAKKNLKILLNHVDFKSSCWNPYLMEYFPRLIQEKFSSYALNHVLRQDLLCTILTNQLVDVFPNLWIERKINAFSALNIYHAFELFRVRQQIENCKDNVVQTHHFFTLVEEVFRAIYTQYPQGDLKDYLRFRVQLEESSSPLSVIWNNFIQHCQLVFKNNFEAVEIHV
ncbi:NAD-glutamate dehydrogenase domain-containing protein [Holospora curviuscula]|uniref:NAD-specific glutamate dehydrogenase n=1 Tax=Holospora curviuscula TaxID=1082868 RepID=A0A2S5R9D5_9PROT|nr:NAD-glutamate dehydrogenase domain-containing protein [Holospora curviuscula]PPE03936.1 NAD-specific glutamate dehydrogenase [Holospora curviuscula]